MGQKYLKKMLFFIFLFLPVLSYAQINTTTTTKLQPLTVMLDWFVNPDHAPLFVAQQQGFFAKHGLQVNFIPPADPSDPPKLVAANQADIAITYQPQLLLQVTAGLPLVRIGTLIATPLNALVVNANSTIHSIKDLRGKKIGYSTGGVDSVMLKTMLKQNGLSLKDVELINVHYGLTQALLTGKVDAVTGMMRNFEVPQMQLNNHPARAFFPEENGMPLYDELVLVTNKNKLQDPRLGKFLAALTEGVQYLINHPEECWQTFASQHPELNNPLNKTAWFATLSRFALSPAALDKSRYENYALYLQQNGVIKNAPELNTYAVALNY